MVSQGVSSLPLHHSSVCSPQRGNFGKITRGKCTLHHAIHPATVWSFLASSDSPGSQTDDCTVSFHLTVGQFKTHNTFCSCETKIKTITANVNM